MVDCFEPRYVQSRVVLLEAIDELALLFSLRVGGFPHVITCGLSYVIVLSPMVHPHPFRIFIFINDVPQENKSLKV
jgi:hypothetical protein